MSLNIYLNSKNKTFGNASDFEFQTNLNAVIRNSGFEVQLEEFTMPFLEYGVNSKNNTLIFEEKGAGTDITCTVAPGSYDITSFLTVLKNALELNGVNTYSCTYNTNTKKITIDAGADTFRLVSGNLLNVIGFEPQTSFATNSIGSNPINLSGTAWIDVYSNLITNNYSIVIRPAGTLLCRIPCNLSYGELIEYSSDFNHSFTVLNDESINNLRISLYDQNGELLELPDSAYCSIVLSLKYDLDI